LKTDPAYKKQRSDSKKAQHKALRTKVLNHYGHKCNCLCGCSVTTYEYLTFDHINGREGNHRRQQNNRTGFAGQALVKWLIDNNYPDTIQILCYNCNCSKGAHGVCPRVKELQEVGRNDQPHTFKEDFYPSLYL
jgi:5-methylcytosine-specific restriction endonuclease McrA